MKTIKKILVFLFILFSISIPFNIDKALAKSNDFDLVLDLPNSSFLFQNKSDYSLEQIKLGRIFPGVKGKINIIFKGARKNATYSIHFNDRNKPKNLVFYYQGVEYQSLNDITENLNCNILNNNTATIEYEWKYETGNTQEEILENDKIDAKFNNMSFSISVIVAEELQVLPKTGF